LEEEGKGGTKVVRCCDVFVSSCAYFFCICAAASEGRLLSCVGAFCTATAETESAGLASRKESETGCRDSERLVGITHSAM